MEELESIGSALHIKDRSVDDLERWGSLATATAAIAFGLSRRSVPGICLALAATPLAYRGLANRWPRRNGQHGDTRAALSGERGIHVKESIRLEQPIDDVYRFWRRLENLPQFMTYLEEVTDLRQRPIALGRPRSGGHARGLGCRDHQRGSQPVIGWRSLPGSDVVTAGSVNFDTVRGGRSTQVTVHLQYRPPAGRAGRVPGERLRPRAVANHSRRSAPVQTTPRSR